MPMRGSRVKRYLAADAVLAVAAAISLLAAASCSGTTEPVPEFGQYTLVRVNGQSLPVTLTTAEGTIVVQGATLRLVAAAGSESPTYTASVSGTRTNQQETLLADEGRYTRSGNTLSFASTAIPGIGYVGTLSDNTLTITVPGAAVGASGSLVLVFDKQ